MTRFTLFLYPIYLAHIHNTNIKQLRDEFKFSFYVFNIFGNSLKVPTAKQYWGRPIIPLRKKEVAEAWQV